MSEVMILSLAEMIREIERPEYSCVSFDVFDTLVSRTLEHPEDLFFLMNPQIFSLSEGLVLDFHEHRRRAEGSARERSEKEEISLEAIYAQLREDLFLPAGLVEKMQQLEISAEIKACRARPSGRLLWEAARKSGKRIICISDMYLPEEVVARILRKADYDGMEALFVSSSHGVTKQSGKLFGLALQKLELDAGKLLHIGDNPHADGEAAQKAGITALPLPRSISNAARHPLYAPLLRGTAAKAHSPVKGLLAERLFDRPGSQDDPSLFQGSRFNLGYACLGPMITGFALWLAREAKVANISRLYFLAREGWILQQAYEILAPYGKFGIPSSYFYSSRRALFCAFLHKAEDIRRVIDMTAFFDSLPPAELLQLYFDVACSTDEPVSYKNIPVPERKKCFTELCLGHAPAILRRAEEERALYLNYARRQGLDAETKPGIVDSGTSGTSQWGLALLLDRVLAGFYFFSGDRLLQFSDSVGSVTAYSKNFTHMEPPDAPLTRLHIVLSETLMGHSEPSLRCFARNRGGKPIPIFFDMFPPADEKRRIVFTREVQEGALSFVRDFAESLGDGVTQAHIDPEFAQAVFRSMVSGPPVPEDATLWLGQYFESVGTGMRSIPLTYTTRQGKVFLWCAPGSTSPGTLDARAANFTALLKQRHGEPFDPSLKKGVPGFPALRLPELVSSPAEYAAVSESLSAVMHKQLEHVLGTKAFAGLLAEEGCADNPTVLASLYTQSVRERYCAYLRKKSEELADKDILFFGCGAAYERYKDLFRHSRPQCMLLTISMPGGTPKTVDGLPVLHPRDVLGKGEFLPLVLFARAEHSGLMLDFLTREYPEYEGDLTVTCLLLPEEFDPLNEAVTLQYEGRKRDG